MEGNEHPSYAPFKGYDTLYLLTQHEITLEKDNKLYRKLKVMVPLAIHLLLLLLLLDQWNAVAEQSKAEATRLREQLKRSQAALLDLESSYEDHKAMKSTIENLKCQMCEHFYSILCDPFHASYRKSNSCINCWLDILFLCVIFVHIKLQANSHHSSQCR